MLTWLFSACSGVGVADMTCSVCCMTHAWLDVLTVFNVVTAVFVGQVLAKMLSLAVERLETNRYMTPDEKYRNIRVVPHLLW